MKFFNREDLPWVSLVWESYYEAGSLPSLAKKGSFWWRDILKLLDKFKGLAMVNINNAKSCFLWTDLWNNKVPMHTYPELFFICEIKDNNSSGSQIKGKHSEPFSLTTITASF